MYDFKFLENLKSLKCFKNLINHLELLKFLLLSLYIFYLIPPSFKNLFF